MNPQTILAVMCPNCRARVSIFSGGERSYVTQCLLCVSLVFDIRFVCAALASGKSLRSYSGKIRSQDFDIHKKIQAKHKQNINKTQMQHKFVYVFLCSVYVLVYVLFVFFVSIICVRPYFYVFCVLFVFRLCFFMYVKILRSYFPRIRSQTFA